MLSPWVHPIVQNNAITIPEPAAAEKPGERIEGDHENAKEEEEEGATRRRNRRR
jgi:hypothetical protein